MQTVYAVTAFLFGACVGSFLNVVAHRLPRGESLWSPSRSYCPSCREQLSASENVPLLAWPLLRGRCRHCGEPISVRYFLVELLTAVLFAVVVTVEGADEQLLLSLPFVSAMVVVSVIDLEHRIVPNKIVLLAAVWGVVAVLAVDHDATLEHLLAGLIAGGAFAVLVFLYPRGMGMGDAKLVGVMGLYLGRAVIPALFFAFALGAIVGVGMILSKGSSTRKTAIPFAPFLAAGGVLALFVGEQLLDWYSEAYL